MTKALSRLYLYVSKISIMLLTLFVLSCGVRNSSGNTAGYRSTTVSYYANKFEGKKTASGEVYRHHKMTGASKSLPFGTKVELVNVENDRSVVITVNDRGPLKPTREFDISQGAFRKIANLNDGIVKVKYRILN
ncbi:rare lipoprotein A [Epilithonimonas mollis]|uniref:Probable endolytic peptidoglycan transglycosylase RlpA n=2 Tax=Epilithonimonas mollis TaxID=216903 RepID=A0A1M6RD30_9FLAO|nr:rare lipoprotein A [Epilithonimonas mollis]